ncbi:HIG1 domain family member 2A, mitochondrial [Chionoecetes opilio]|uniref:HIG1 domain family member 2A, mitochondrial n=1 Tax=Chionoecetes opilio TaxID=41210 RepID=A0A8J8WLA7_CHIOP|nr:HIG1 domain family member 2A, mitochondrial [Chionoecetes opilio]
MIDHTVGTPICSLLCGLSCLPQADHPASPLTSAPATVVTVTTQKITHCLNTAKPCRADTFLPPHWSRLPLPPLWLPHHFLCRTPALSSHERDQFLHQGEQNKKQLLISTKPSLGPGCYAPDKREITVLVSDLRPLSLGPRSSNGGGISPFYRKFHENPFVPIGCGLTTLALCYGLYGFSRGRHGSSQKMMRLRVAAQGFTVVALMMGIAKTSMHAATDIDGKKFSSEAAEARCAHPHPHHQGCNSSACPGCFFP